MVTLQDVSNCNTNESFRSMFNICNYAPFYFQGSDGPDKQLIFNFVIGIDRTGDNGWQKSTTGSVEADWGYSNWRLSVEGRDCVRMFIRHDFQWSSINCDAFAQFICEYDWNN